MRCHSVWQTAGLPAACHPTHFQVGGAVLGHCFVKGYNQPDGTVQQLRLWSIDQMPSLERLLAAVLPAATQTSQLRSLAISYSRLPVPAVQGCPFLGHLTSLALATCTFPDGGTLAGLEALMQQAPRLQSLALGGFFKDPPFPPALINRTGLRRLCVRMCGITELPPGPYLNSESACPPELWRL